MPTPEARLAALYRYPVKGLTPEPLDSVELRPGETLPFDRAYAIENGPGRFDPAQPRHLPKINFLMLMRDERLATLRSSFDDRTQTLTIARDLSRENIRVNTIQPGIFDTPAMARAPQEMKDALGAMVPYPRRLGNPDEFASMVLEMIRNRYINGETVRLDGAIRMQPR